MARALLALSALTGHPAHAERARSLLERFATGYASMGIFAAGYASAVLDALEPPLDVKIAGAADDLRSRALRDCTLAIAAPPLRVDPIDPATDRIRASALHVEAAPEPVALVCRADACFARATSAETLRAALAVR